MTAEEVHRLDRQFAALLQPFTDRKGTRIQSGEPLLQDGELPVRVLSIAFPNTFPRPDETSPEDAVQGP
jgi:hypothetical protein